MAVPAGLPGAEATLRRVVDDGILLVSTGGADFTRPRGRAVKVGVGYRVSGHMVFASQSSYGDVMSTMFAYVDPEQGQRVLNVAVPVHEPGVTVLDNWDVLGMRGTASNDIVVDDVFVPDARVLANRPYGVIDPPLMVIVSIAMPIISAVYLGVGGAPGGRRGRGWPGRRSRRAAPDRPHGQPPAGGEGGPSTAPWPRWATTRSRRSSGWPP